MPQDQESEPIGAMAKRWLYEQILGKLPYPTQTFEGQTIIVTGANSGMGFEAARHLVRLQAAKVIIAVRSLAKGEEAAADIVRSENCPKETVEVWLLDLASYESTIKFAKRAEKELKRLDVVVANAGVYLYEFAMAEKDETTITVNVVNTFLMGLLLLPKLRQTSLEYNRETVLTFVGSFVHYLTEFPEQNAPNIFEGLAEEKSARMNDRYNVSKTIELLLVRELASHMTASSKHGNVVASLINPGFVSTAVMRHNNSRVFRTFMFFWRKIAARTAEQGGRTLVYGAYGGQETHGKYLDNCEIGKVSPFIVSEQGHKVQKKLWEELAAKLELIEPGVMSLV